MGRRNGEPARSDYLAAAVSEPDPDIKLVLDVLEDVKSIGTAALLSGKLVVLCTRTGGQASM